MKLETTRHFDLPRDRVFAALADFDALERRIRGRGGHVARIDDGARGRAGARWDMEIELAGRTRAIDAGVTDFAPHGTLGVAAALDGVDLILAADFTETTPGATTLDVMAELKPRTMAGRLLIQPLKLGRQSLIARIDQLIDALVDAAERESAAPKL